MDITTDSRIVMTMDAGGTNFVFSALAGGRNIMEPIRKPSHGHDLQLCLQTLRSGFSEIRDRCPHDPVAISFAFPGPADYPAGIIGDLANLPAFRGGIPLGPMLADHFGLPTFINNDGDLFTYGEAISGLRPEIEQALAATGSGRQCPNLLGVTLGTGFGAGLVIGERPFVGNNGAGMEIWSTRSHLCPGHIAEEGISARAVCRLYAQQAKIPLAGCPDPERINAIASGAADGDHAAAVQAFKSLGEALGDSLADAVCLTDSLVVIGGGLSGAHPHFLAAAVDRMNGQLNTSSGASIGRMEVTAFNLEDPQQRTAFINEKRQEVRVPGTNRTVPYTATKSIGVGISLLGTSEAVARGAYAHALANIEN